MAYGWAEHVGELELWVDAPTVEGVFADALRALGELAFLAETEGFVPASLDRLDLATDGLRASVSGPRGAPPHLVKAVTYHRLSFEPHVGGSRPAAWATTSTAACGCSSCR